MHGRQRATFILLEYDVRIGANEVGFTALAAEITLYSKVMSLVGYYRHVQSSSGSELLLQHPRPTASTAFLQLRDSFQHFPELCRPLFGSAVPVEMVHQHLRGRGTTVRGQEVADHDEEVLTLGLVSSTAAWCACTTTGSRAGLSRLQIGEHSCRA